MPAYASINEVWQDSYGGYNDLDLRTYQGNDQLYPNSNGPTGIPERNCGVQDRYNRYARTGGKNIATLETFEDGNSGMDKSMYDQFKKDPLDDDEFLEYLLEKRRNSQKSVDKKSKKGFLPEISDRTYELITFIFSGICLIFIMDIFVRLGSK